MVKVIGVRFRTAGKVYFFDPLDFEIKRGDNVIVETLQKINYGIWIFHAIYVFISMVVVYVFPFIFFPRIDLISLTFFAF